MRSSEMQRRVRGMGGDEDAVFQEAYQALLIEMKSHAVPPAGDALRRMVTDMVTPKARGRLNSEAVQRVIDRLVYQFGGYGPIQPLLLDPTVTEIMINSPKEIWFERDGKLELSGFQFNDEEHLRVTVERMVTDAKRRIDEKSPMAGGKLPAFRCRLNAVIQPVARHGPYVTIRKHRENVTFEQLLQWGAFGPQFGAWLVRQVLARKNILISGGTGTGKTTTLNVVASLIPQGERIIVIEDDPEIDLDRPGVVYLESRPPNLEGEGEITIRYLVKNALRMRPDRIVVGEVRGGEALDMLQAMNTGHDGSLTTAHANDPEDALKRLEIMVLMSGMDLPLPAIQEQIASALDYIIQLRREKDGSRRFVGAIAVEGYSKTEGYRLRPVWDFERDRPLEEVGV